MHKPIKTFFLLLLVMVALGAIALLFPKQGIRVGNNCTITFPSLSDIFLPDTSNTKDINQLFNAELLANIETNSDSLPTIDTLDSSMAAKLQDSSRVQQDSLLPTTPIRNIETKLPNIAIEHSDSAKAALRNFFESLLTIQPGTLPIRVLHYGDSQIEVDRISSRLRKRLQEQFGGGGYGFITLESAEQSYMMSVTSTNLWDTRKIKNKDDKEKKDFGPFFSSARIGITESGTKKEGYITISQNRLGRMVNRFSFCYRPTSPLLLQIKCDEATLYADIVSPSSKPLLTTVTIPASAKSISIKMQADQSPLIFGLGFDNSYGVAVDNIPIRGSSGLEFTRENFSVLSNSYQMLNARLILLEFGVNVVPTHARSYGYYEEALYRQLMYIRKAAPKASVMLIGVSDISKNENGRMVSHNNIEPIRDAQKRAAFRAGCAFWDCYKAMGGKNSMPAWVSAQPPLANKDYIHFTIKGANLIGDIFYKALMKDYQEFLASKNTLPDGQ
ncbi:SGNH/GDSL hydrolase family protein [Williamwhitmania taraxaci]|uniref:Lysophospholipase L1 n=1 Tax=Williamwhitmania taraxaci TaxID=1640674 RepID=A0A1G6I5C8_9BACT|nr:hypothetical protein [Williamwhitmania taraxaci]SDC01235.1 Lysophospholipase L1 [Williamwhitmania taraxaci]